MFNKIKNYILSTGLLKKEMKPFFRLIYKHRLSVLIVLISSVLVSVFEGVTIALLVPILEGLKGQTTSVVPFPISILSSLFNGVDIGQRIRVVALLMLVVVALKGLFKYINNLAGMLMQVDINKEYRILSFKQLLRLGMGDLNRRKAGEIQSFVFSFPTNLGGLVCQIAVFFPQLFTIMLYLSMLIILSWQLTLLGIVLLLATSLFSSRIVTLTKKATEVAVNSGIQLNNFLIESFSGIKVTHLFNRERDALRKFEQIAESCRYNDSIVCRLRYLMPPLLEIVAMVGLTMIMIAGSFLMGRNGLVSLEALLIFIYVLLRMVPNMLQLNQMRIEFAANMPYIRKVISFIDPSDKLYIKSGTIDFQGLKQGIEFRDLTFSYMVDESVILRNMSIFIPKGKKIGIVGPSGAGKSTITELLLRFYDPEKGQLLIDDIDLKDLDLLSWRKYIGVVSQETFLFNDTVRNNIAYAKPGATQEEIGQAARRAHAHDFISEMPRGYDTILGERGILLSGGQRQRIAIARAILCEPEILVFDEATSSLDTESERIVQQALDEIGRGRTVITIAHRLSTVSDADKIFVIEGGSIVEQGDHLSLLGANGLYKKLVEMQSLKTGASL
ncbi:MAG: xenobiotic-transporting ATPase [Candidatus Saganbacteria bacterium]|uniref:Xenobiotic-transporting ATPase n=1 Tax=Candidatus Saganbacteria bacterium TaxID=2575572 RepID=A0A833NZ77_UNCSA|nr:MAG: xenobiotic-transporting ATPase [Candidatus Saganbacteria bacterium]